MKFKHQLAAVSVMGAVSVFTAPVFAAPIPIDLSSWQIDGGGNWTLFDGNNSVNQSRNSRPTVFYNNLNSQGTALSGTIRQGLQNGNPGGGDDDFFGFVLGYDGGDLFGSNATTDYVLVDWKQVTQSGWDAGMAISRVTGSIDTSGTSTGSDAWQHTGNVSFIERAATLGNVGWVDNQEYLFDISFTSTNITVDVDGVEQFNIDGTFEDGSFGFYNFSQPQVNYAGIGETVIPPECGDPGQPPCEPPPPPPPSAVPAPATVILLGFGMSILGLTRRKRAGKKAAFSH